MKTPANNSVQSVERVLDIIELLAAHPHGMALTEIAEGSGLHVSTTHRLLGTLAQRGYVGKLDEIGKYRLTLRTFEVGSRVANSSSVLSTARPLIEKLGAAIGESVHLVLREGSRVVYIFKSDTSLNFSRMGSYVGLQNPMYCTGVGKSILALLPQEEVKAIWDQSDIIQHTPATIMTLEGLYDSLDQIRQQGYSLDWEEHEQGISCVAVAVRNFAGEPIAAVSVSAPTKRIQNQQEELIEKVCNVAGEISRMLGFVSV